MRGSKISRSISLREIRENKRRRSKNESPVAAVTKNLILDNTQKNGQNSLSPSRERKIHKIYPNQDSPVEHQQSKIEKEGKNGQYRSRGSLRRIGGSRPSISRRRSEEKDKKKLESLNHNYYLEKLRLKQKNRFFSRGSNSLRIGADLDSYEHQHAETESFYRIPKLPESITSKFQNFQKFKKIKESEKKIELQRQKEHHNRQPVQSRLELLPGAL